MYAISLPSAIFLLDRGNFSLVQPIIIKVIFVGWIQDCGQIDIAPDNQFGGAYSGTVHMHLAQCFDNTWLIFKPLV